jgi:excisionase family DNA binding protein
MNVSPHAPEILSRQEASSFLRLPIRTLDYLVTTGQIPFSRIGRRRVVFQRARLLEYLRDREGVAYHRSRGKADERT